LQSAIPQKPPHTFQNATLFHGTQHSIPERHPVPQHSTQHSTEATQALSPVRSLSPFQPHPPSLPLSLPPPPPPLATPAPSISPSLSPPLPLSPSLSPSLSFLSRQKMRRWTRQRWSSPAG